MKKTAAILFSLLLCLILSSCTEGVKKELTVSPMFPEGSVALSGEDSGVAEATGSVGFSLWSVSLGGKEDAEEIVSLLKKADYTAINLAVMWSDFETAEGVYDWEFLDGILDTFVKAGYGLNLSVVFWDYNLSFAEKLDLQETATGKIYTGDSIAEGFLCLNSENNIQYMKKALLAFCSHVSEKYRESLLSWEIRLSETGEAEYAATVDLDYSETAFEVFLHTLKQKYSTVSAFNTAYGSRYDSWEEITQEEKTVLTSLAAYDWKLFKQDSLISFANAASEVFRAVDGSVPVVYRIGTVGDSMSALYRGIFDPYTVATKTDCDILCSDTFTDSAYGFYLDMLASTTGKNLMFEAQGPRSGEAALEDTLILAEEAGKAGIGSFSTANWKQSELETYYKDYISLYPKKFLEAEIRPDPDETEVIIINTLDFIIRKPPSSLYGLYKYAYKNMTGKKEKRVLFYTDTQVIENPSLLDGVTVIHLGALNNVTYMYDALGEILAAGNYTLVDDDNQQPNFINEQSLPLDFEVQDKLRARLKES